MTNSPPGPGPDLFFAGGECLTRFGVWVRRTDMDLEAATQEVFTRNSDASAIGRDAVVRNWQLDTPRAEWLNEVDLDATRNLLDPTDMRLWNTAENAQVADSPDTPGPIPGVPVTETIDPAAGNLARVTLVSSPQLALTAGQVYTASVYVRRGPPGTPTANLRLRFAGGTTDQWDLNYDPVNDVVEIFGPTPQASGMEPLNGGYRRIWITQPDDGIRQVDMWTYPAWRSSGTGATDAAATGSNLMSAPQIERGAVLTKFQQMPRDTDRKTPSLLLEDGKTNQVLWSEDFSNAGVWLLARSSITPNLTTAPDGTLTMDKLVEEAVAANTHYVRQVLAASPPSDNDPLAWSVWVVANERSFVQLGIIKKDGTEGRAIFWVDATQGGQVGFQTGLDDAYIQKVGSLWFRCTVVANVSSGGVTPEGRINLAVGPESADVVYDGDGTSGLFLWGAQAENNAMFSSSYIKSENPVGVRLKGTFDAAFPHPPQEMTIYTKAREVGAANTPGNYVWQIGTIGTARLSLISATAEGYRCFYVGSVTATDVSVNIAVPIGSLVEVRITLSVTGLPTLFVSVDGAPEVSAVATDAGFEPFWTPTFFISNNDAAADTNNQFLAIKAHRGVRSLDFMRSL